MRGEPVTTLSDVYSLGVILNELVTGAWPFGDPGSTMAGLERALGEMQPNRPASSVTDAAALARSTPRPKLERALRGDLGNILLKAIESEPHRRYGSVEELANDLNHFLEGRPVLGRSSFTPASSAIRPKTRNSPTDSTPKPTPPTLQRRTK